MKKPTPDSLPLGVLLGSAALVAAVTFAASAHGLYDFGGRVMGLPGVMAACVPIGLDALQLVAIAAAFKLQKAQWHIRLYVWLVIGLTVGASMASNAWDARVRGLTPQGIWATMATPVLLALTAHVIVVTWRHHDAPVKKPATVAQPTKPKTVPAARNGKVDPAEVQRLKASGMTQREVAKQTKSSVRTVARHWTPKPELVPSLNGDAA